MAKTIIIAVAKWAAVGYMIDCVWSVLKEMDKNSPMGMLFKKGDEIRSTKAPLNGGEYERSIIVFTNK